jgi:hypothetical protein
MSVHCLQQEISRGGGEQRDGGRERDDTSGGTDYVRQGAGIRAEDNDLAGGARSDRSGEVGADVRIADGKAGGREAGGSEPY